ncbi:MAG: hypothetical protein J1E57_09530 [Prevotella sp.]|nr:hypothetical protein [Prevotella sp.]
MMNIPNYEECIKYALEMKGITGDTFKDTTLRVYQRHAANPGTVFTALRKGGIIIPVVKASLLGEYKVETTATVVVKANQITDMVELYVPKSNDIQTFPIATFVEAWEAANGVSTTAFPADEKTYCPKLIDLKHVGLPHGFEELREAIAENAHDRWALERQSEGWTFGPKRDDSKLETPDMVPYSQLPESEKQYDRLMAEDTLKLLTALGYKIEKNPEHK